MKKIEIYQLDKVSGGNFDWCTVAPAFFPPIILGCVMRDIDRALGN